MPIKLPARIRQAAPRSLRETGAEVREETEVENESISSEDQRSPRISLKPGNGTRRVNCRRATCSIAADGNDPREVFSNSRKLRSSPKIFRLRALRRMSRPAGRDGTLIRMVRGLDRWFWMIPLTATRMSIGVVMDARLSEQSKLPPEEALEDALASNR